MKTIRVTSTPVSVNATTTGTYSATDLQARHLSLMAQTLIRSGYSGLAGSRPFPKMMRAGSLENALRLPHLDQAMQWKPARCHLGEGGGQVKIRVPIAIRLATARRRIGACVAATPLR